MDPQQRLLLEAAWEAAAATGSAGSKCLLARPKPGLRRGQPAPRPGAAGTGVFVGASYAEWALLQQQLGGTASSYSASGSGLSVLAGERHRHRGDCRLLCPLTDSTVCSSPPCCLGELASLGPSLSVRS